jgi:hypothetical protein
MFGKSPAPVDCQYIRLEDPLSQSFKSPKPFPLNEVTFLIFIPHNPEPWILKNSSVWQAKCSYSELPLTFYSSSFAELGEWDCKGGSLCKTGTLPWLTLKISAVSSLGSGSQFA